MGWIKGKWKTWKEEILRVRAENDYLRIRYWSTILKASLLFMADVADILTCTYMTETSMSCRKTKKHRLHIRAISVISMK